MTVSDLDLDKLTVLIIGGTSGIGLEVARLAARSGARVHLMARGRDVEQTEQALRELRVAHEAAHTFMSVDVRDAKAFDAALLLHMERYGVPDCVFHSVGDNCSGRVTDLPIEAFDQTFQLNVRSAFVLLRRVLSPMMERRRGALLFNASVKGLVSHPEDPLYCASKAALVSLVQSVSLMAAPSGVRVNCICPGPVQTRQLAQDPAILRRIPLGMAAHVAEVASVACFLLSDRASYITGAAIPVDGGKAAGIFPPTDAVLAQSCTRQV